MLHIFNLAGFRFLHFIHYLTKPPNKSSFSDLTKHKLSVTEEDVINQWGAVSHSSIAPYLGS
jgi:hypothetical protein